MDATEIGLQICMFVDCECICLCVDCGKWEIIPAVYNNNKFYHTHLGYWLNTYYYLILLLLLLTYYYHPSRFWFNTYYSKQICLAKRKDLRSGPGDENSVHVIFINKKLNQKTCQHNLSFPISGSTLTRECSVHNFTAPKVMKSEILIITITIQ